jgi:hypothetical protein
MTNLFAPDRFDERIVRLAVGVEPIDAVRGGRVATRLRVLVEDVPAPLHRWRTWRPGEVLDHVLPGLDRHPSGRFARVYGRRPASGLVVLRVVDTAVEGPPPRQIVPRRLEVAIATEATVAAADLSPAGPGLPVHRVFSVGVFPGAMAPLGRPATVVRGRVTRLVGSAQAPVRWTRVSAVDAAGEPVGWAHGDDRGEFVLVVRHPETAVVVADDPLSVALTIGASLPPLSPDPADPLRPVVDPLWDLPVEPLPAAHPPATSDRYAGRALLPGQTTFGPFPFDLPLGGETTVHIQIP